MPNRITLPRWIPAAAGAVVLVAAGGVAYGAASQPANVTCTTSPCTITVAVPTKTVTQTVTAPAQTVTATVTAAPSTTSPTSNPTSATTSPTSAPTTTSATSSPTTTTPPPTGACPVAGANKPGASDGKGGCFPGPGNVGVPAGTQLAAYAGPIDSDNDLTVMSDNVTIDGKTIGAKGKPVHVRVAAKNFTLKNSVLYGIVTQVDGYAASYTVADSVIDSTGDTNYKSATGSNVTLLRNDISGSFSGGVCDHCLVQGNWFHKQWIPAGSSAHMSAYRMDQSTQMDHNTLSCDFIPPQGLNDPAGCSADLTGYGDWAPVQNNTISRNLIVANPDAQYFCSYGGSSGGKAYSGQANNVKFTDNVFQKGRGGKCGAAGPITDFDPNRPGNVWSGNKWDDGTTVNP